MANNRQIHSQELFEGERVLFASKDLLLDSCVFDNGESPLKESHDLKLAGCMFKWKYPLWYCNNVEADGCTWFEMARAGVWYSNHIAVRDACIQAPKNFRRCTDLALSNVDFTNAQETLWHCGNVRMENVHARGDYFGMNCEDVVADGFVLDGNYSFDGARNVEVRNARMLSKDAFWNCENVVVRDSFIAGEYLAWNSHNVTFENCTIESLQGLCYVDGLVLRNCTLVNTTLAFEYSAVDAQVQGRVESVLNPASGTIKVEQIGELIVEPGRVDAQATAIDCRHVDKRSDAPEWLRG